MHCHLIRVLNLLLFFAAIDRIVTADHRPLRATGPCKQKRRSIFSIIRRVAGEPKVGEESKAQQTTRIPCIRLIDVVTAAESNITTQSNTPGAAVVVLGLCAARHDMAKPHELQSFERTKPKRRNDRGNPAAFLHKFRRTAALLCWMLHYDVQQYRVLLANRQRELPGT